MKNVKERENEIELSKVFMLCTRKKGIRERRRKRNLALKWKWNDDNPGGLQVENKSENNECVNKR